MVAPVQAPVPQHVVMPEAGLKKEIVEENKEAPASLHCISCNEHFYIIGLAIVNPSGPVCCKTCLEQQYIICKLMEE